MTLLREKILALSDDELAQLIIVADRALCDLRVTEMIADETAFKSDALRQFSNDILMPLGEVAEVQLGWYNLDTPTA